MAEGVSGAVLLGFIFYNSIIGAVPAAVFVPFYIHIRRKNNTKKEKQRILEEFKEGMNAVAVALRAGYSVENAFIEAGRVLGTMSGTGRTIGTQAGVDEVIAGVLPDEKAEAVGRFKSRGKVIMVGDGINDAPALTSADIGLAIGAGTDIAIDAADVVLMKSRLSDVVTAIRLSRATLRNIHENLFWAFIYNIIGIPLAAGVWIQVLVL